MTPAGFFPAKRAKSIAASVCPVLRRTPPSLAISGKMCPGRDKSCGRVFSSTKASTVNARSLAEIPVVTPLPFKSTETVKAVSIGSVLLLTIRPNCNSLHRLSVKGAQINPRPSLAMKLMISGEIFSAAVKKSPSFSRLSSSTTMMTSPFLTAAMASSI